jgi:hypothetical protein
MPQQPDTGALDQASGDTAATGRETGAMSTTEIFTDTAGRSLARIDAEYLAGRNMAGSSPSGEIGSDAELLEWATGPDGDFSERQAEAYGIAFLPAGTAGMRREDFPTLS